MSLHGVLFLVTALTVWQVELCVGIGLATARRPGRPKPVTPTNACCVECGGTGMIRTGDGRDLPCGCPATCKCKANAAPKPSEPVPMKSILVNPQPCPKEYCPPTIKRR